MKLRYTFVIRRVAETEIAVAVGDGAAAFHGMIKLNASGKLIFEQLMRGGATVDGIVQALQTTYGGEEETVREAVGEFLTKLREQGLLEEEAV